MRHSLIGLSVLFLLFTANDIFAHPGSGIVVDRNGNIYFIDTGSGVWHIDPDGNLSRRSAPAYHWMTIDDNGVMAKVTLPRFSRGDAIVTRDPDDPRILVSSDFPIAVGRDGSLYYPWQQSGSRLQIFRLAPSGTVTAIATLSRELRWLNGMVAAPDGSVYYTENNAIRRISPSGELTTVVSGVTMPGCDPVPGVETELGPYLRDLDVDSAGTVYVAATGCGAVLRITPDKEISTVLKTSPPWSPTAVAISDKGLLVLEYLHTPTDDRREWLPRVRRVSPDGSVITIASIDRR